MATFFSIIQKPNKPNKNIGLAQNLKKKKKKAFILRILSVVGFCNYINLIVIIFCKLAFFYLVFCTFTLPLKQEKPHLNMLS